MNLCCGYGKEATSGFDCLMVPGAVTSKTPAAQAKSNICGRMGLKVTTTAAGMPTSASVCCASRPDG